MNVPDSSRYRSYADLCREQRRGRDFEITLRRVQGVSLAVIAPHAGEIENGTSDLARAIAGEEYNLYLFEGIRRKHNYRALHLTSHCFDEPECLDLVSECDQVIAVHGCRGAEQRVMVGGRDANLKDAVADALRRAGLVVLTEGHAYPAVHPANICNRGRSARGVQLEVTHPLRVRPALERVADAVRSALERVPRVGAPRSMGAAR
jgi:phage replication-related protein YjqB (UPF0714/DUF867 family)